MRGTAANPNSWLSGAQATSQEQAVPSCPVLCGILPTQLTYVGFCLCNLHCRNGARSRSGAPISGIPDKTQAIFPTNHTAAAQAPFLIHNQAHTGLEFMDLSKVLPYCRNLACDPSSVPPPPIYECCTDQGDRWSRGAGKTIRNEE